MFQTFGYIHEFRSRSEIHGKLIATCWHDITNKYIIGTRAVVGRVFRLLEISTVCVVQSLELGTGLQIFGYIHEVWPGSEVHGKLIATCPDDFTNQYITATRALVGAVFRLLDMSTACVVQTLASTPPGMPGTHPHQYFGWGGRQWEYPHQYYYVLSDIADQY